MVRKLPKRAFEDVSYLEAQVVSFVMDQKDGGFWRLTFYVEDLGGADWLMNCYPRTPIVMGIKALDYDNPNKKSIITEGERALKKAGMLCRNIKFQKFMREEIYQGDFAWGIGRDEEACGEAMHEYLGVESRKELVKNHSKIEKLNELSKEFELWARKNF